MMEMADNPKMKLGFSSGLEEKMVSQKISVSDHVNAFQYTTDKSDKSGSFVIDMEAVSHASNKDTAANSRMTRSFSRKGSLRGGHEKKMINSNPTANDSVTTTSSSPRAAALVGASTPEKPAVVAPVGATDHPSNPQIHHQITIYAGNISTTPESKYAIRRNSFKRSPPPWLFDPKRILFFFATLSSMGTILLIYFTLSIGKLSTDESMLN